MLTKGMATDWGKHGLRVNAIAPGYFKTELNKALVEDEKFSAWLAGRTPMGRWGDVEELVGAADLPGFRRLEFRQWPHPLCRRRDHRLPVTASRSS